MCNAAEQSALSDSSMPVNQASFLFLSNNYSLKKENAGTIFLLKPSNLSLLVTNGRTFPSLCHHAATAASAPMCRHKALQRRHI